MTQIFTVIMSAVNLTVTAEGKYRALDCAESLRRCRMFTEIFRNRLAEQLRHGGYELRQEKDGFEIVGVPTDAIKLYSKSRAKITEAERLMEERLGRAISNDERPCLPKTLTPQKQKTQPRGTSRLPTISTRPGDKGQAPGSRHQRTVIARQRIRSGR